MITKGNLKEVFEDIDLNQAQQIAESDKDYILMELMIFNAGSSVAIEVQDYDPITEEQALNDGQLFVDRDDFFRLYAECGARNPHLEAFCVQWMV